MNADSRTFVSVHLTPEARDELRQAALELTSPAGRKLSMSAVAVQAVRVAMHHQQELVAALVSGQDSSHQQRNPTAAGGDDVPADRTGAEIFRLTDSFAKAQELTAARAERLAHRIAEADDDIWNAALSWATTGEMPAEPVIEAQTPARLSAWLSPSQTFTALMGLRIDPDRALSALHHSPHDLPDKRVIHR